MKKLLFAYISLIFVAAYSQQSPVVIGGTNAAAAQNKFNTVYVAYQKFLNSSVYQKALAQYQKARNKLSQAEQQLASQYVFEVSAPIQSLAVNNVSVQGLSNLQNQLKTLPKGSKVSVRAIDGKLEFLLDKQYGNYGGAYIQFPRMKSSPFSPLTLTINGKIVASVTCDGQDQFAQNEGALCFILERNY